MPAPTSPRVPEELPLLALRSTIVFPHGRIGVQVGSPENIAVLESLGASGGLVIVAVGTGSGSVDAARLVNRVGVVARVSDRVSAGAETVQVTLQGIARARIVAVDRESPFSVARVEPVTESMPGGAEARRAIARIVAAADSIAEVDERFPAELSGLVARHTADPSRAADVAAAGAYMRVSERDELVQCLDVGDRLVRIAARLEKEVARAQVIGEMDRRTNVSVEQHQREFFLRQQLQAIRAELGERDPAESDADTIVRQIAEAGLPEHVEREARRETDRLRALPPASSEYQVLRNYLEWVLALPWSTTSGATEIPLDRVEEALDERHYGLEEAKERILEYLSVRKLLGAGGLDPHGPILCFVGPPGTGKTSLGEAIATSIGRAFHRISVGGVRDEAEVRGHRRTYVGSMPGLIVQAMRRAQARDPVLMIDEIDKMAGGGPGGDPLAAMLEVLDPSQNATFVDHYLNVPFDLSRVLFICTANTLLAIPPALRDRMEVIRIAGYTVEEKVEIAWRYLLPRLFREHGITDRDLQFTDESLSTISNRYSREAGLRGFERNLAAVMRRRARRKAQGENGAWVVDAARIDDVLGSPRYAADAAEIEPEVGTVTGLAWTANGGELMTIEALRMPGTGKLHVTGQLGDVMRESVDAACSYVRSMARVLRIEDPEMKATDLHIHFPAGSVPKDGPSAGVAVTLAIASVMSRRPVRRDVAVTGEVTLRGKVLEIGGVKEKVLAAYRSGLREVLIPVANEKDLRGLPDVVRDQMRFTTARSMDDVIDVMLLAPLSITRDADRPTDEGPRSEPGTAFRDEPAKLPDDAPTQNDDAWPA
ncbi:MAG: endopeptidase La [Gemmatimonadetes bacterium]|nr:endopeptidase La [Gemmatimonadota bacterium]